MSKKVTVYRFKKTVEGRVLSPRYMAGTAEAIELLGGEAIEESARQVEMKLLEGGFYYEHTPTSALPNIDSPKEAGIET
jgi:hypothetical protein